MELRLGSWQLILNRPEVATADLMAAYSRRAANWGRSLRRLGMERAYDRIWRRLGRGIEGGCRVLDAGSGDGALAASFHRAFPAASMTLLDLNPQMLERAERRLDFPATFVHANAASYRPQGACYDVLISAHLLEHFADPAVLLDNWRRCLVPGGTLVVVVSRRGWFTGWLASQWKLYLPKARALHGQFAAAGFEACRSFPLPGLIPSRMSHVWVARAAEAPDSPASDRTSGVPAGTLAACN